MKTLAQMSFDYLWLLNFAGEDVIDLDYSAKQLENLPEYFSALTTGEKQALTDIAREAKSRLLAEPDRYGYTPRRLVTDDQITFLDALISGEAFEDGF